MITTKEKEKLESLSQQLFGLIIRLNQATEGWCVTYETPEKTREWVSKLHSTANSVRIRLEEIQESLSEEAKRL